jgi:hypothetical protein
VPNTTVSILGLKDLIKKLDRLKLNNRQSQLLLDEIGSYMLPAIEIRTLAGKDVDGNAFKPYTPKYALFRLENNRQASPVNLKFSGTMLGAMTHEADSNKVRLFFLNVTDPSDTRVPAKAFFLNEQREFFAISDSERSKVLDIVDAYIKRQLRKK